MGDRAGSIPVIRTDKKARHRCVSFFYGADAALAPVGSRSPLRSVQSQRPQDVVHPVIRTDKKRDTGVSRFMKCGILKDVFLEWNS